MVTEAADIFKIYGMCPPPQKKKMLQDNDVHEIVSSQEVLASQESTSGRRARSSKQETSAGGPSGKYICSLQGFCRVGQQLNCCVSCRGVQQIICG